MLKQDFPSNLSKKDKLAETCKICRPKVKHEHYINNKSDYIATNAKRRADILERTPKWADLEKIKEIYKNCPADHHVDHVIPLKGINVSGLHVENNLQYLPATDNLIKSNKFST